MKKVMIDHTNKIISLSQYKQVRLRNNTITIYDINLNDFGNKLDIYKDLIFKNSYKVLFEYENKQSIILYN